MNSSNISERSKRLGGLRRFAAAITIFNVLGHTVFGFEQSWAQPLVALATAYGVEILLELIDAWANRRPPCFAGSLHKFVEFLLSAHITGLAVAMLIYTNEQMWPIVVATTVAIGSKAVFRVSVENGSRHFLNPSNFGISVVLLLFPWVGAAPPYHFTENLFGFFDWLLPALILVSGTFINARFTGRLPLVAGWLGGFFLQAMIRSLLFGTPFVAALLPMTGLAFILYTFYMVTDPATTPSRPLAQVAFGASVAATYGLLMVAHIVFGLFFALTVVCSVRGLGLYVMTAFAQKAPTPVSVHAATAGGVKS
jgi:Na+-translocating ferredoxin:NAD+ oxidoreductase RnfD subunit